MTINNDFDLKAGMPTCLSSTQSCESRQTVVLARLLYVHETPMQFFFARFRMTCTNFANGTKREHEISQSKITIY